ncbi:hypothetical protein G5I_04728 [Acromyrmex echinatior]|uniref:Uncharacterized protein n=1 Tax=Acromyrmex echinatior TaxID=103372 RepID=F4WGF3_ACREC|nr:hypothetical protein G5I_04728 [Acromyrmex echinatior]
MVTLDTEQKPERQHCGRRMCAICRRIKRDKGYAIPTPSEYRNRVFSEREGAEQEESNGDHHRGCEEEKEERRGRRETERTSSACPDIANASEVSTERRRNNWHSARTFNRGTKGRGHGGNDDARGGCGTLQIVLFERQYPPVVEIPDKCIAVSSCINIVSSSVLCAFLRRDRGIWDYRCWKVVICRNWLKSRSENWGQNSRNEFTKT